MNPTGRPSASASRSGGNAISPRRNRQIAALFADGEKTPTEQFWEAEKKIKAVARILVDCLDGHSRSKMEMYLCLMYRHKIIGADDLEEFSGEMKERILLKIEAISE